jgi:lipid-A-disaccharide synthase
MTLDATIIIPTYNRKTLLSKCLDCLFEQDYPVDRFEIIVVDDNGSDGTEQMVQEKKPPCKLTYVRNATNQGCGVSRNNVIPTAQGNVIIFLDDDALAPPWYVREHVETHRKNPGTMLDGPVLNLTDERELEHPQFNCWDARILAFLDFGGIPFIGANSSCTKEALLRIGCYDPDFGGWEDLEIAERLKASGLRRIKNRQAYVLHCKFGSSTLAEQAATKRKRAYWGGRYYTKHPSPANSRLVRMRYLAYDDILASLGWTNKYFTPAFLESTGNKPPAWPPLFKKLYLIHAHAEGLREGLEDGRTGGRADGKTRREEEGDPIASGMPHSPSQGPIPNAQRLSSLYITANSPGEIAGFVAPVASRIKLRDPSVRITLVITPCQYASGAEKEVAREISEIDETIALGELLSKARSTRPGSTRVFFLGGDTFYAALIARKLNAELYGFVSKARRPKDFTKFFLPDERTRLQAIKRGVPPEKLEVVGQLALDSIEITDSRSEILRRLTGTDRAEVITFLPGSRPYEVPFMTSFFLGVARSVQAKYPGIHMVFAASPFVGTREIIDTLEREGLEIHRTEEYADAQATDGIRIRITSVRPHEPMSVSKLVITIPGTNNLQIAGMGVPLLVVLPLNKAELIPFDGLAGILLPKFYPLGLIRRFVALEINRRMKFVSLPNMIADREIVPEVRGILKPEDVAAKAIEMLDDQDLLDRMSAEMLALTRDRGAADRIADALLSQRAGLPLL